MADMSKGNLCKELMFYIRNNWSKLSFRGIDGDLVGISELHVDLKENYKGKGIYSFEAKDTHLRLKAKEEGGKYQEYLYKIEGKVYIEEGEDIPIFKIEEPVSVYRR